MDDTSLLDAEFDCTALGSSNSGCNVGGDGADLRVRHHATGAENLTETTDERHHVRGCNAAIEFDLAAIDDFEQFFRTDDVGASLLGFFSLVAASENSNANRAARAIRQVDDAADHLVGVARIDAEVHRDFDGFIELGDSTFLDETDSSRQIVQLVAIDAFTDLVNALGNLRHRLSPPLPGPSNGQNLRSCASLLQCQRRSDPSSSLQRSCEPCRG